MIAREIDGREISDHRLETYLAPDGRGFWRASSVAALLRVKLFERGRFVDGLAGACGLMPHEDYDEVPAPRPFVGLTESGVQLCMVQSPLKEIAAHACAIFQKEMLPVLRDAQRELTEWATRSLVEQMLQAPNAEIGMKLLANVPQVVTELAAGRSMKAITAGLADGPVERRRLELIARRAGDRLVSDLLRFSWKRPSGHRTSIAQLLFTDTSRLSNYDSNGLGVLLDAESQRLIVDWRQAAAALPWWGAESPSALCALAGHSCFVGETSGAERLSVLSRYIPPVSALRSERSVLLPVRELRNLLEPPMPKARSSVRKD